MTQEVCLYFNDCKVDFKTAPELLFNYKQTDTENPTVVRNSYTKSVTIEGTDNNNDIFGHIWNLERIQMWADGNYAGVNFNPLVKSDFVIYANGTIYETGYFKLNNITKKSGVITYNITLYGGLGSFFYALTYNRDTNGEINEEKKFTLADLDYTSDEYENPTIDFRINKETVNQAWNTIIGGDPDYDDKWQLINFCPAYEGVPDDFDSNKVLINTTGLGSGIPSSNPDDTSYGTSGGYLMAETSENLTQWDANNDLRSYHQRPCIRLKRIIEAICNPQNNGGFEVALDPHFFNVNNPYYEDAWITLPRLKELDLTTNESQTAVTGVTIGSISRKGYAEIEIPTTTISSFNNLDMKVRIEFTPETTTSASTLYTKHSYKGTGYHSIGEVRKAIYNNGVIVQMVAYNELDEVVATSDAYELIEDEKQAGRKKKYLNDSFSYLDKINVPNYVKMYGKFVKQNGRWFWANNNGSVQGISFRLNTESNFSRVVLKIYTPNSTYTDVRSDGQTSYYHATSDGRIDLFTLQSRTGTDQNKSQVYNYCRVTGNISVDVTECNLMAYDAEALFTDTLVTKKDLLTNDNSVCDYLLSYAKMFGLKFYKDPGEDSSDFDLYPEGVIHIVDRNTFYHTDEIVDLSSMIDRSKDMVITPITASAKWYTFNPEAVESECNEQYKATYGMDYGEQKINTGYNFDGNTTELLEDNLFKGAVMALKKSKYFQLLNDKGLPAYTDNGLKVTYYKNTDTKEYSMPVRSISIGPINVDDLDNMDTFPKLQFHTSDNSPSDGSNVLVFFRGYRPNVNMDGEVLTNQLKYYITDDIEKMVSLNDGTACWLLTKSATDRNGNTIAKIRSEIPYFSRWIDYPQTGVITHSWDFAKPQSLFVPNLYISDGMSLYEKVWKNYITDLYSVDTRKLTCYCMLQNQPTIDMLRRFYWFDNCLWTLSQISEWNIASDDPTKCEFIKVQDLDAYKMDKINGDPITRLYLLGMEPTSEYVIEGVEHNVRVTEYELDSMARDVKLGIYVQDGGSIFEYGICPNWITAEPEWESESSVQSNTTVSLSIAENSSPLERSVTLAVGDGDGANYARIIIKQSRRNAYIYVDDVPVDNETSESVNCVSGSASENRYFWEVINNVPSYTVTYGADWVSTSYQSNRELWMNIEANPSMDRRSTSITFEGGGVTKTVTLVQLGGVSLTVDDNVIEAEPTPSLPGHEIEIPITPGEVDITEGNNELEESVEEIPLP